MRISGKSRIFCKSETLHKLKTRLSSSDRIKGYFQKNKKQIGVVKFVARTKDKLDI